MLAGPFDMVVVITDVPLVSSRERFVPGLSSPLSRVAVISTKSLRSAPREMPKRSLDEDSVLGTVFDAFWKNNKWSVGLLEDHLEGSE